MSRAPVSIVILAWNSWETTRACLDSLRPTLGPRDQVVVVDNGSTDATPAGLRMYPWVEMVTNTVNRGFAGGCNDGAAQARADAVIFLNNDTVLSGRWIDPLVGAFDDPAVGAAGPRSNFVSGEQLVPDSGYRTTAEMRRFARQWSQEHKGQVTPTNRLVGFCLAVRRSLFVQLGGFDEGYGIGGFEDDDLCRRIEGAGFGLVICHESFVHHEGHKTFDANGLDWYAEQESNRSRFAAAHGDTRQVLVSACLITKDEEAELATCLESLRGFADEVIIYDTGSTDGTVELARSLGAIVEEGYWDDDFSRARNAALARCRGDWIAWLDADETLQSADPGRLRELLMSTKPAIDAWSVRIQNLTGTGAGSEFWHSAARLFRRDRCEWIGRVHEQIARRGNHGAINQAQLEDAHILHRGYLDAIMTAKAKSERNLRLSMVEVEEGGQWDRGYSLVSLARSQVFAGRFEEALANCREVLECTDNSITRRLAARAAVDATTAMSRFDEALAWCGRLRREGAEENTVASLEATIHIARQDWKAALRLVERVVADRTDGDGFAPSAVTLSGQKATALAGLGRYGEAADTLIGSLASDGALDSHLGSIVAYLSRAGRPLDELARAIPSDRSTIFLAQILQLEPDTADQLLLSALEAPQLDRTAVLATASTLARDLPLERAVVWSAHLRSCGHAGGCPLLAVARSDQPPVLRARAAAIAQAAFTDSAARAAFSSAVAAATPAELASIRTDTASLCPGLSALVPAATHRVRSAPTQGPRVSIVIPLFNRADMTLQCLQSLAAQTEPGSYEVILVDNASTDQTRQLEESSTSGFRLLRNPTNLGFARACNQGAAQARTAIVLFLNNDIVALPGWLPPVLAALDDHDEVGIVGSRLLFPDGSIQHAGVEIGTSPTDGLLHGMHRCYRRPGNYPGGGVRADVAAVTGAALAIRRDLFEAVGGFDERYWNGNEDVDLCLAVTSRGHRVLYEPASTLIHFESQSGAERWTGYGANVALFNEKWAGYRQNTPVLALSPAG